MEVEIEDFLWKEHTTIRRKIRKKKDYETLLGDHDIESWEEGSHNIEKELEDIIK